MRLRYRGPMLEALAWGAASGVLARWVLPQETAGPWTTFLCGLGGCVIAFVLGHELLGFHELHLFEPESLIPAVLGTVVLLLLSRRARASGGGRTLLS